MLCYSNGTDKNRCKKVAYATGKSTKTESRLKLLHKNETLRRAFPALAIIIPEA